MLFLFHLFVQLRDVVKRFIDISAIYFNLMKAARNDEDEILFGVIRDMLHRKAGVGSDGKLKL